MAEIDHVHFLCADPEGAARFFQEHFGASEVARVVYPDWYIIRLQLGSTLLALSPPRASENVEDPLPGRRRGFYHIGIRVVGVDAVVGRLRAAGVPILADPREIGGTVRVAYVAGPDGVELELLEPVRQSPVP
jgi:lactoylglutathione lyase